MAASSYLISHLNFTITNLISATKYKQFKVQSPSVSTVPGELVRPEVVLRIADQLDERDQKTPRMRAKSHEALEQYPRDLLLENR